MSADKLDMSLEDIIKMNRQDRNSGKYNSNNTRGNRGNRRYGAQNQEIYGRTNRIRGVSRGGIQKMDSRLKQSKEIPDQWQHDLFEDYDTSSYVRKSNSGDRRSGENSSGTLLISNLHFGVNDSDMKELFSEFGRLMKAAVHYDKSGRSLGTAEIVFENCAHAVEAMKRYNNVPLDGELMKITLLNENRSDAPIRSITSRIGPIGVSSDDGSRPPRRLDTESRIVRARGNFGGGRGQRRGGRPERSLPTKEELDAELDAYNAKMDTE